MNPNGPSNDPSEELEAAKASNSGDEGAGSTSDEGNSRVSSSATSSESETESASSSESTATLTSKESAKIRQQQTEKSGLAGLIQFITEALIELKKITWPDRQQVIKETLSVIVLVAIITGCVLAFDYGIAKAVFEPLDKLARHLGGGIGVHH